MRLVFDLESNGLLREATTIHCLAARDIDTEEDWLFEPGEIEDGLALLDKAELLVAHNGHGFDAPVLHRLHGWEPPYDKLFDTLIAARLVWSDLIPSDIVRIRKGRLPKELLGSHGLEAYGYRLGLQKGTYSKDMEALGIDPWARYSKEMGEYCRLDCAVTAELYRRIEAKGYAQGASALEHKVKQVTTKIEMNGFGFHADKAMELYAKLCGEREAVHTEMLDLFEPWYEPDGPPNAPGVTQRGYRLPKRDNKKQGVTAGEPYTKIKTVHFNPASRHHIAGRLQHLYGWQPSAFTGKGQPKVDSDVLSDLPYPPAQRLAHYFVIQKIVGYVGDGDSSWLKLVTEDGRLHGSINPQATITGRCSHSYPNIAQTPSVGKAFGQECRELFYPGVDGWVQVGADASGLELRCLAHYLQPYDGGSYAKIVTTGDVHEYNREAAGLETRAQAKVMVYGTLYGAGDELIGTMLGGDKQVGKEAKERFFSKVPGFKKLKRDIERAMKSRGCLYGLDGRRLTPRSHHAALNMLLQSAGALLCKQWLITFEEQLQLQGLVHDINGDYAMLAFVHDEIQTGCRADIADDVARLAVDSIPLAGDFFNFKCPLTGEAKIGNNWADCH